ncbi:hypothetical protein I2486_07460 [Cellulophaga sp. E16_2]|uniref:hypothetical protein n=1 Tax=unclassified Cellulophaga TaxID=2634405 RepID=UPI0013FD4834|nr:MULTISPECIES: hypothetical protein [unclassified Cellulophaga]MBO0591244.1 hypothetical protein [Cellulophaga sp. E16_2]
MKTLFITIFLIFTGITAQAQESTKEVKVETTPKTIVTETSYETSTARLYMYKNSRVKKELTFTTKANKTKLA